MSYSRRQLYAMGEPIGDSVTRRKAGGVILGDGGGGGQPTSSSTTTSTLPDWALGYAKDTLSKASQLTDINKNPYQTYGGQRNAELAPMQVSAMQGAANMSAGPEAFSQGINAYMSPYMQNVVDIGKREAARQSGIQGTQQQAQATSAGGLGGGRDAIMRAERERNLGTQMSDIQDKGMQSAYDQAAGQFRQGITQGADINRIQAGYGGMQQGELQKQLDTNYGDFQNQMNFPYKQLGFMSDMIRGSGAGTSSASTVYQAPGSMLGQLGGLGVTAMGLSKYMADGGQVHGYAGGGAIEAGQDVDSEDNLAAIIHKLPDQLLQQAAQAAAQRGDQEQLGIIQEEMAMRASLHRGIASVVPSGMADMADEGMAAGANGGIVAFDEGGTTSRFSEFFKDSPEAIARRKLFEELKRKNEAMIKAERDRPGLFEQTTPERISSTEAKAIKAAQEYLGASRSAPQAQSTTSDPTGTGGGRGKVNPEAPPKREAAPTGGGGGGGGGSKSDRPSSAISDLHPAIAASVDKALADMAASGGASIGSFKTNFKDFHDMLSKDNEGMLQTLKDQITKGDQQVDETKGNALGNILAAYGANWAANAAKPGATFLGSAAAAAPAANESMLSQDKILREMNDAQNKIKADFTKFQISLKKDDQKTAVQAAQDMERNSLLASQIAQQAAASRGDIALKGQQLALEATKMAKEGEYQMARLGLLKGQIGAQSRRMDVMAQDAATRKVTAQSKLAGVQRNLANDFEKNNSGRLREYEKKMGPVQAQQRYESEKRNYITSNMAPYISGGSSATNPYPIADNLLGMEE
jgi:hypothetical protein